MVQNFPTPVNSLNTVWSWISWFSWWFIYQRTKKKILLSLYLQCFFFIENVSSYHFKTLYTSMKYLCHAVFYLPVTIFYGIAKVHAAQQNLSSELFVLKNKKKKNIDFCWDCHVFYWFPALMGHHNVSFASTCQEMSLPPTSRHPCRVNWLISLTFVAASIASNRLVPQSLH